MTKEFLDSMNFELAQIDPLFEKEAEPYLKFYRYMLIQYIKESVDDERERRATYNFIRRPEGEVFCGFIGIKWSVLKDFFKKIKDDESFRVEIKSRVRGRGMRTQRFKEGDGV